MERIIPALILCADALNDLKRREIFPVATVVGAALGVLVNLAFEGAGPVPTAASLAPGMLFLAVSAVSRGQVGGGDALAVLLIGAWTGLSAWRIFILGLFGAAVYAGVIWMMRRRNAEFPFLPFLLAGFVVDTVMMIIEG